jgi:hypothetical protein
MLKTRGGHRFEGYGNVKLGVEHGTRAGWQLICYECQGLSDIIHRTGQSYPPKVLDRMFSDKGWKVGQTSASDVCPKCLEKRRQKHKEERKQYAKGNVDRLLDMIRQIDLMLASNVALDFGPYQPQIAAQLKSLFETAYLCNMLAAPPSDHDQLEQLRARQHQLEAALDVAKTEYAELRAERDELMVFHVTADKVMRESEPPPPPAPEPPPPEPPPPAPEVERMSPRTAAFLADIRKQIFKGAAA